MPMGRAAVPKAALSILLLAAAQVCSSQLLLICSYTLRLARFKNSLRSSCAAMGMCRFYTAALRASVHREGGQSRLHAPQEARVDAQVPGEGDAPGPRNLEDACAGRQPSLLRQRQEV